MANRRSFLIGIGAALAAPAIVRAESLMKLWVPPAPAVVAVPTLTEVTLRAAIEQISRSIAERQWRDAFISGSGWVRIDSSGARNIDPWGVFVK